MLKQKVLIAYSEGSPLSLIADSFGITQEEAIDILRNYKEQNLYKKSFTDDFKKMVAERDTNGGKDITRSSIAKELNINPNTVKKICEEFGNALKEKAISDQAYTRIDREFDLKTCPSCNSKRVNIVDFNTTYCLTCGNEHIHKEDHVLKINYEYLEE
ncbi:hypothetical protein OEJ84_23095 (plasmid) [Bacillus subtilis]|uniref:Transposase n=1 Tax=Bacillus phage vB_BsuS_PJN02 TaxID=2920374 RepID=A0AC61TRV5_9CAUD|nr:hypothetical protein [Bacillus subtilis]YP_010681698.1 transposase [Bacillus phage vB_BsuS_PJN02]UNH58423.1 transposase [Bacillus phage vB_BsuS_PJN02]WOF33015.1 hypothetical protein OEJ84_23095 [Bacillus subtilis]